MMVWTYWEGERSPLIDLCLQTMADRCLEDDVQFTLVTPDNIGPLLPAGFLRSEYLDLPQPALRADAIRAALLARYGGWWWDADTVALRSPRQLPDARALYMSWAREPFRILNGYIFLCQDLAAVWLDAVNKALVDGNICWCSLGERLLTQLLPEAEGTMEIPRRLFLPIDIDSHVDKFFSPGDLEDYIQSDTVCFGLNYSWFMYHRREQSLLPADQWAASPLLIHRLLNSVRQIHA